MNVEDETSQMPRDELLDVYYDLYSIFESIETIADALRELQQVHKPKKKIIEHLEALRLLESWHLSVTDAYK